MLKSIIRQIFRCLYYLLYHQFSWAYDYVAALVSFGRWNTWVLQTLPYLSGQRILEIGFGPGHLLCTAIRNNIDITGIDESRQMVKRAAKSICALGYIPPIIHGDVCSLPFPARHFNQVVSTFPSEFILNPRVIAEIYRVLLPEGQLIILPFAWIQGKLWYEKIAGFFVDFDIITHYWNDKCFSLIRKESFETTIVKMKSEKAFILLLIATKLNDFTSLECK